MNHKNTNLDLLEGIGPSQRKCETVPVKLAYSICGLWNFNILQLTFAATSKGES